MHTICFKKYNALLIASLLICSLTSAQTVSANTVNVRTDVTNMSAVSDLSAVSNMSTVSNMSAVSDISNVSDASDKSPESDISYQQITMEEAYEIFSESSDDKSYLIIDVRTEEEYSSGHIPGAVNVPNDTIGDVPPSVLTKMDQTLYVYCRSGNRSKQAAEKLAALGYTNIIECGGIQDWEGGIVTKTSLIYTFGKGMATSVDSTRITISLLDDNTLQLSGLEGTVTEDITIPDEEMDALFSLIEDNLSHLERDMSHTCVADSGYTYLYYNGAQYGGYSVQNSWFKEIQRKIREVVGQETLSAFSAQLENIEQKQTG